MVHNWVTLFGQLPFNNLKSVIQFRQKNEPSPKRHMKRENELLQAMNRALDIIMAQDHQQNADALGYVQVCDSF